MNQFEYTAINARGKQIKGQINARSSESAVKALQTKQLHPIEIRQIRQSATKNPLFKLPSGFNLFKKTIPIVELADFTRQFGTLIETGIPYHRALDIISGTKSKLTPIIEEIRLKVLEGSSLYKAMSNHQDVFKKHYLASVLAGEKTGRLGINMLQQAEFMDSQSELKSKVQSAMIYPSIMMLLGIGIVIFMIEYILPKIVPIFSFFDRSLPIPTRIMVALSDFIANNGLFLLFGLLFLLIAARYYLQKPQGQRFFDQTILKLPIIGPLKHQLQILRFSMSLGSLLNSGINVKEALLIASSASGNVIFDDDIKKIQELTVTKGYTLSAALKTSSFFDDKYVQIVKVGEESGRLEEMINKLSQNLKTETQGKIQKFVALLEPAIILTMALMVGLIVLSILLPIFELNTLIQ